MGDRITEIMEDLNDTRTVEVPNKGIDTPRMETRVRAHQTDARHLLKRSNAGHAVNWDSMHQTVPQRVLNSLSRQGLGQNELYAGRARGYGLRRGSPRQCHGKRIDPCGEIRTTHRKDIIHHCDRSSSPSPSPSRQNLISATGDHHPAAQ